MDKCGYLISDFRLKINGNEGPDEVLRIPDTLFQTEKNESTDNTGRRQMFKRLRNYLVLACFMLLMAFVSCPKVFSQTQPVQPVINTEKTPFPFSLNIGVEQTDDPKTIAKGIQIVLFVTLLTLAPSLLVMVTSFTRITIILNFVKRASGLGQDPSKEIITGLALFLTVYIMAPVGIEMNEKAIKPYLADEIRN